MALAASRPNNSKRYSRSRPESVASDYQGLSIDREALKESYQQSLLAPSTSSIGLSASGSVNSSQSRFTGQGSQEANSTTQTHLSIPSHGHGHGTRPGFQRSSLSPIPTGERSNLYSPTSTNEQMAFRLPPYPALASPPKPTIPPRPTLPYEQSFAPSGTSSTQTHPSLPRSSSAMDVDSPGLTTSSEMFTSSPRAHGKARALPQIPTDVPPPELPDWEPDYKAVIPPTLTAPSIENAYARLSAPPPNLPPRRTQPFRQAAQNRDYNARPGPNTRNSAAGSSSMPRSASQTVISGNRGDVPMGSPGLRGAPGSVLGGPSQGTPASQPLTAEPMSIDGTSTNLGPGPNEAPRRARPQAEKEVMLQASGTTPIWSTHYIDPSLSSSLVMIPPTVTSVANAALAAASSGKRKRFSTTTGAPLDGVARELKEWIVPPDARFVTEAGGIEISLAVIDSGVDSWGKEKGRKKARVEAVSKTGGVKFDVIELDPNRQIDLRIESKSGDVLVLLPDNFHGPIHVTAPAHPPVFLPTLAPQIKPPVTPYPAFTTTFVVPLSLQRDPAHSRSIEHTLATKVNKFVPKTLRQQSDSLDMARDGYSGWSRGEQSKVSVQCSRGRVVFGYRETLDEEKVKEMGLNVGIDRTGGKGKKGKKRWWRS